MNVDFDHGVDRKILRPLRDPCLIQRDSNLSRMLSPMNLARRWFLAKSNQTFGTDLPEIEKETAVGVEDTQVTVRC